MTTTAAPKKLRRKDFPKDANLCEHCTAKCCRYFALPIETPTELDDFNQHHSERCGRPIERIAFYAEVVADALVLPDCTSKVSSFSSFKRALAIWRRAGQLRAALPDPP